MASNYSKEQVNIMIEQYSANPTRETVDKLAKDLDKSIKSIIGKLSREGVYQKAIYKTKTGEVPVTKAEIIVNIAETLNYQSILLLKIMKNPYVQKLEKFGIKKN